MSQSPVAAAIDLAQLLQAVSTPPATIPDVIATMETIDALLPAGDGLKWFNLLYLKVTQAVDQSTTSTFWKNPAWIERLDVVFAGLYFKALASWYTDRAAVPRSWADLFTARYDPGLVRLQFALAGMNAHIDHDLAIAVVQTGHDMNIMPNDRTPEHTDFQNVNTLLAKVEPEALTFIAVGLVGEAIEDLGECGTLLANWSIRAARDIAWTNARVLWDLQALPFPEGATHFLSELNNSTGLIGDVVLARL